MTIEAGRLLAQGAVIYRFIQRELVLFKQPLCFRYHHQGWSDLALRAHLTA